MGGRGSASGVSVSGIKYGQEYRTVLAIDNIKFVVNVLRRSATLPLETMSAGRNRVYVLVNSSGNIKSIGFYDKSGKKKRQIDFTHVHQGMNPHVHIGYSHSSKGYPLSKADEAYLRKVVRIWQSSSI